MDANSERNQDGPFGLTLHYSYLYILEEYHKNKSSTNLVKTPFGFLDDYHLNKLKEYGVDVAVKSQNKRETVYEIINVHNKSI